MAIETTREKVGPTKAEKWINENPDNRALREGVVELYASDMRADNWTNCTAPIVFYDDGKLADGQHRLFAIIESGTTHEFNIMRGLSRKDGLNIDTGLPRSVVDAGRISRLDEDLSVALVSACRAVAFGMGSARDKISNSAKLELVREHREAAQFALSKMPHTKNICNSAVLGAVARAWYWEDDKERLDKFAKVIGSGFSDGDNDSAAIAMRNYLLQHAGVAAGSSMWRDTFLKVMNAIQYFMKRQRLTVIKSVKDEAYPIRKKRQASKKGVAA